MKSQLFGKKIRKLAIAKLKLPDVSKFMSRKRKLADEEDGEGDDDDDSDEEQDEEQQLKTAMMPFRTLFDLKTGEELIATVINPPRGGKKKENFAFALVAHQVEAEVEATAGKEGVKAEVGADAGTSKVLLFSSKAWRQFEKSLLAEFDVPGRLWTLGLLANVVYHVRHPPTPPTPPPPPPTYLVQLLMQVLVLPHAQSANHMARVNVISQWLWENLSDKTCTNNTLLAAWADWNPPEEEEGGSDEDEEEGGKDDDE
jgi:hypothetical protein